MWGYYHTSCAMLELMMSDLPHIKYHNKEEYDVDTLKMQDEVRQMKLAKLQKEGMSSVLGKFKFKPTKVNPLTKKK